MVVFLIFLFSVSPSVYCLQFYFARVSAAEKITNLQRISMCYDNLQFFAALFCGYCSFFRIKFTLFLRVCS